MRSRGVSVSIILQNLAQLKALFEKQWESIVGNCDSFLYLGGNEQSTHKYVSELLGKETIDTNTYGKSTGRSGNYSTNYQISGRELMTPDEVRMLDNRYALLFVRGERPVMDFKYDILKHPNVKLTTDGGQPPYIHGEPTQAVATLVFDNALMMNAEIYLLFQHEYSANFLFTLWKRVRKYGAYCTGITQNVDDLLQSHTARTMLANSEFIIMLNQASTDRIELAKLLNISDLQMSYITNVGAGQGLLKVGSSLVPFVNKFPRNTELYRLMTTKFGEV